MKSQSIKGTQSEQALMKAFASESQAACRYKFFAKAAKKEGQPRVAAIFKALSKAKRIHAMAFYNLLQGGQIEVTLAFPADVVGDAAANLKAAAAAEHDRYNELYPELAKTAEEEGFTHVATLFHYVMAVQKAHEEKLQKLAGKLKDKSLYSSKEDATWKCRKCGHHHNGKTPPETCPLCGSPKQFSQKVCGCGCDCPDCGCTDCCSQPEKKH